jgi:exosortase/archaeosortase family protein
MSVARRVVLIVAALLFAVWLTENIGSLMLEQNGIIRFVLGTLFAAMILLRLKSEKQSLHFPSWVVPVVALAGAWCGVGGIVFSVHQFEWIGLMLLFVASLTWALPESFGADIMLAALVFYWVHPLPNQVFGPLQLAMQQMSVRGAEWLSHVFNVRVWADGFVLKTGVNAYDVPTECSGMKTATTVFLLGLGLGITRRLRWYQTIVVIFAALVQALALNVLRLFAMVLLSPGSADLSGEKFLHDTTGVIVVLAVFLVFFEILLWERRLRRRVSLGHKLMVEHNKAFSGHPPFWRVVFKHKWKIILVSIVVAMSVVVIVRSRNSHRAEMLKDVATAMIESDKLDDAQKLVDLILKLDPDDDEWKLARIRLLVIRQNFKQAMEYLRQVHGYELDRNILTAYSLMGLGRIDQATIIVGSLPEPVRLTDARVAMILAEIALRANNPDEVARNVIIAKKWKANTPRIRALYPYLRIHRKWDAIADSDARVPYNNAAQSLSAIEAHMNLDEVPRTGDLVVQAISTWPDDPRILEPLFYMTIRREGAEWEDRFAAQLVRSSEKATNPDVLYQVIGKCFQMGRPDLAWFLYRRIGKLDPSYPGLAMSITLHGDAWFSFRRQYLGFNAPRASDTIDLKPLFLLGCSLASWRNLCDMIPAGIDLCAPDTISVRKRFLQSAISGFRKRDEEDKIIVVAGGSERGLSVPMRYEYVRALEIAGDIEGARKQLEKLVARDPLEKEKARLVLSEIYERRGDWPDVYETLRGCAAESEPSLPPLLRLCQAEIQLHLGLAAVDTARTAVRFFPDSTQAAASLAKALTAYDTSENALLALVQPRVRHERDLDVLEAECLYATQRFSELTPFCRSVQLPTIAVDPENTSQGMTLPPAEAAAIWHFLSVPSGKDFDATAKLLGDNLKTTDNTFLKGLIRLWLDCHAKKCLGGTADPNIWLACGRDDTEKAVALNQLAVLLCWQERYTEARDVTGMAVKCMPHSPLLWRMLISLSGCNLDVVGAARRECPSDSEIWLAELVIRTQLKGATEEWAIKELAKASKARTFTPAAMTRVAEYFLRGKMMKAASMAARDSVARARGLLPAYMVGMQCALFDKDRGFALECARGAIKASLRPLPAFYKKLVEIKADNGALETDTEMVEALRNLRLEEPDNPQWSQMLGYVRFKRGGWEVVDAVQEMQSALQAGATNKTTYIIAAESCRIIGNADRAVDILQNALKHYPDDADIMNNLAYTLCLMPDRVSEAVKLAPRLEKMCDDNITIMDTLTMLYLKSELLGRSGAMANKILQKAKQNTPAWFRAKLRLAEIAMKTGKSADALSILNEILRSTHGISEEDLLAATTLQAKLTTLQQGADGTNKTVKGRAGP